MIFFEVDETYFRIRPKFSSFFVTNAETSKIEAELLWVCKDVYQFREKSSLFDSFESNCK
jgi:hypothetical protein